ncbi:MalY/PatB family protein [Thetidibacter halocola]|uniref:cysteine-S-conjugate beta-lyase n=1 Tax=Thetidibacter halocola TaxID=2827239 RepID=A0A8J8B8S6_9RHOB|nr:PatB family C-S lyase [Thetidibacter halocola]MBS0124830.1 PatB family C-S lyase [Thetidibacter halocola]
MNELFDRIIDRRGTGSSKWDRMKAGFGVSPDDGLGMTTADSDWPTAPCVIEAVRQAADHGIFGYMGVRQPLYDSVAWWMGTRHGWQVDPDWVVTVQGLGFGIAMCLEVWSEPGDGVAFFTPVYHEFRIKTEKAGRIATELPLERDGDTYHLNLDDAQARLTGREKILLWCSPQNPSGRVWTVEELRAVADFAERNDLLLVSDEVHHDLVYPGQTFVPMHVACPEVTHRLVVPTAASKTFNVAGMRVGSLIIPDAGLRYAMRGRLRQLDYDAASLGMVMTTAAYSPEGAAWVDAQVAYLQGNIAAFDALVNAIPGVRSLPLQSTYLGWVDFSGTGMDFDEFMPRIRDVARIAASPGPSFGAGGERFMRFNLAMPRARIEDAGQRLQRAFSDLQ